ncbi:hypothetical protein CDAR_601631 [Caerostris darwini]|uniref:Uncharacterized protein n=1 Tax=Caerostris darwini TaxID=1538125 RepID=A0AAV4R2R1_9ARAC|nr:hypothetical protein CDAR_601631 [Caerostris darwini]
MHDGSLLVFSTEVPRGISNPLPFSSNITEEPSNLYIYEAPAHHRRGNFQFGFAYFHHIILQFYFQTQVPTSNLNLLSNHGSPHHVPIMLSNRFTP